MFRHSLERVTMASMSHFPGRILSGRNSPATIPRRVHASNIKVPQVFTHNIVHTHPPNPPTRRPVTHLNVNSKAVPKPMRRKNPPVVRASIPRPSPHTPKSCRTAETTKAPRQAPGLPNNAPPGRAPNTTRRCRKNWCQRKLQNSMSDVAIHGRSERAGHAQSGCRSTTRPKSVQTW
jgi:hypothetical protein